MTATVNGSRVGHGRPPKLDRLLLASDLSPASDGATDHAFALAHRLGASLLVVSVIDSRPMPAGDGHPGLRVDQLRERRESIAQDLVARGRELGVPVNFLVWEGDPGEAIVEAAVAEEVDLIVVGSHGRSVIGRFLIGSVSEHVVRHAPCPVLVVRGRGDDPG